MSALRFHFDFISPYAYLAWTQIHALAERHGRAVEPVPVLFAALLDHHGTKGPAEIPAKRRYLMFDVVRKARALGVPIGPPPAHPFNPLLALRVASLPMELRTRRALIDRLYAAAWSGEARDLESPAVVAALAREAGLDRDVLAEAATPDAKARLRQQTEQAIADGVFGVPTVLGDGEPFWGVDALPDLERFLATGTPALDADTLARWTALAPSATRPASR
ncbi:MAG TPA: 2-hydroxychromene-2-carboxylate isomerase [Kofleriaceae bacterium]|nr:2-hydroxychromene-2-carboxylate isomerase [Kofleriaceae bacterium]